MAEKFNQVCDAIKAQVAKSSALSTVSQKVEEATKVNFEYFVLGLAGVVVLMLFTGILADEIVSAAAFYYPAYASLKALETKSDTTFWVTYWVVYSTLSITEGFLDIILYWMPFYYPLKLTFVLYLYLPQTMGASTVYSKVLKPLYTKGTSSIDGALDKLNQKKAE